jgi:hypothetical protein
MTIGVLRLELFFPNTHSLKDRRSITGRIKNLIRNKFNVSIVELDTDDKYGRSVIGIAVMSNGGNIANNILRNVENFVESNFDVQIVGRKIEVF